VKAGGFCFSEALKACFHKRKEKQSPQMSEANKRLFLFQAASGSPPFVLSLRSQTAIFSPAQHQQLNTLHYSPIHTSAPQPDSLLPL
jgi:hypothetical protein